MPEIASSSVVVPDFASATRAIRIASCFSACSTTMRGLTGQAAVAWLDRRQQMRHGRHHHVDRSDALLHQAPASRRRCRRASRSRRCGFPASPARSADRRAGACASASFGRSFADLLDQRMADIAAGRPAELPMHAGLERQQRQHVVDVAAHRAGAARPPGPDRGRDVVDDRDRSDRSDARSARPEACSPGCR